MGRSIADQVADADELHEPGPSLLPDGIRGERLLVTAHIQSGDNALRQKLDLLSGIKLASPVQMLQEKYFSFFFSEIGDNWWGPGPQEGRIAIVTDVGQGMRWT